jgi:hypothetical protein
MLYQVERGRLCRDRGCDGVTIPIEFDRYPAAGRRLARACVDDLVEARGSAYRLAQRSPQRELEPEKG